MPYREILSPRFLRFLPQEGEAGAPPLKPLLTPQNLVAPLKFSKNKGNNNTNNSLLFKGNDLLSFGPR